MPALLVTHRLPAPKMTGNVLLMRRELAILVALLGFALVSYASIIPTYFLSDDFSLIGRVARSGVFFGWGGFVRAGTILSYAVDHALWGFNPVGYHLTNVLFHGLAAYGVYLLARYFFERAKVRYPLPLSILAACLFVALPSHSESVSWISGRTDVIAVALGLAATYCFLHLRGERPVLYGSFALALLAAALVTKESVIVLPPIWGAILAYESLSEKTAPSRRSCMLLLLSFLLLGGYFLLRKATIGELIGGYGTRAHLSIFQESSLRHLFRYGLRTFLPASYRLYQLIQLPLAVWVTGFLTGVIVSVMTFRWLTSRTFRWSLVALLALSYLVSVLPAVTISINVFDTQSERFLYLPSVFACLAIVYFASSCIPRGRHQIAALVLLIAVEAMALQWVNHRWITASLLSKEIAVEVSRTDPGSTVVLNVPDNFQGAYVFRHGLSEAATIFMGNESGDPYWSIIAHDMNSMEEVFEADADGQTLVLSLRDDSRYFVHEAGFNVTRSSGALVVTAGGEPKLDDRSFLTFRSGTSKPMLRLITSIETSSGEDIAPLPTVPP